MPLYEYQCKACRHRFEFLQRLGEGAEGIACPACGKSGEEFLQKQFSTFAAASTTSAGAGSSTGKCEAASVGAGCGPGGFT